jgi:hypothetical protein
MGLSFERSPKPRSLISNRTDGSIASGHIICGSGPGMAAGGFQSGGPQRYRRIVVSEARYQTQHSELVYWIRSVVGCEGVSHFHKILADRGRVRCGHLLR